MDIATLRREWEAKREMTSTPAGSSRVASVSADDSVTTPSPGSQHRQTTNDEDDDTDIDVEDDSTMDKNIHHQSQNRYQEDINITSDEETNYTSINTNSTSSTTETNKQQSIAATPGCDVIISYCYDSKQTSQDLNSCEGQTSPSRTPRPSATKRSNPFSIESLLFHAEEYTD